MQTEDLLQEILRTQHLDGITISGGEPFMQADACAKIAAECRSRKLTVWVYTGYRYEDIVAGHAGENAKKLLQHIDVLVDGPFELEHRSDSCKWRGSTNQRLIDIPASQANPQNAIVLYEC